MDGRTVVVEPQTRRVTIELQYIDVPRRGEQMHDSVTDHLRNLVKGKIINYRQRNLLGDRTFGHLMLNDIDVNQQMLRDGAAWHIPSDMSGQEKSEYDAYASTDAIAKNEKRGVWSVPEMKPAWELRGAEKEIAKQPEQNLPVVNQRVEQVANHKPVTNPGQNPAMGDVGALLNGYDAKTKTATLAYLCWALPK
ncbi:MAG: thermonuclease family protein [Pyrinomonadaceae bacterium]